MPDQHAHAHDWRWTADDRYPVYADAYTCDCGQTKIRVPAVASGSLGRVLTPRR